MITTSAVKEPPPQLPLLSTMFESSKPTLTRFQMFGWTWIGIIIYLAILFSTVSVRPLTSLTLSDIGPTMEYRGVVQNKKNNILVIGNNFGQNKDTV
jgi:hypothetical protein